MLAKTHRFLRETRKNPDAKRQQKLNVSLGNQEKSRRRMTAKTLRFLRKLRKILEPNESKNLALPQHTNKNPGAECE